MEENFSIQIFAGDISMAVSHKDKGRLVSIARKLKEIIHQILQDLDLQESIPKCNNFIIEAPTEARKGIWESNKRAEFRKLKETEKQEMLRALEKIEMEEGIIEQGMELPYKWQYSFKLLGIILDCHWAFEEHVKEMSNKVAKRLSVISRVASTAWGLECRVLSISAHALLGSVINYGLAVYGTHCSIIQAEKIDSAVLNKVSRKITEVGVTV